MSTTPQTPAVYEGKDLEAMSVARNYSIWILKQFDAYIGNNLLEVGAGMGNMTRFIIERYHKPMWLIEPSDMADLIPNTLKDMPEAKDAKIFKSTLGETLPQLKDSGIDSIFYINVLEHIEHDQEELKLCHDLLPPGGHVLSFSPALPQLYGKLDARIGHYRRYYLDEMKQKMQTAGFEVVQAYYFDFVGMFLWWVKYKLLGHDSLGSGSIQLYDSGAIPILKVLEPSKFLPIGKNIVVIGRK